MDRSWITASEEQLPLTREAAAYAAHMHEDQRRADGSPFVLHPLEVGSLLHATGAPDHLVAAGVMHDLLEKTPASASDLQERFGPRVTGLVLAVTENERISGYSRRKAALRQQVAEAGDEALRLFAADKLSKLRELRAQAVDPQARDPRARRLRHYRRSLALLEERLPESPLVRELGAELAALSRETGTLARAG